MAEKKIYSGSVGPFLYNDADDVDDADGDFAGQTQEALVTDGQVSVGGSPTIPSHVLRLADKGSMQLGGQLVVPICAPIATYTIWTNMPLATAFYYNTSTLIQKIDLTYYTECRLTVVKGDVAAATGAKLYLSFKTTFSLTASDYSNISNDVISVAIDVTSTLLDSGWKALTANAIADVFVCVTGDGGDGAIDPNFGAIVAHFR